MKDPNFDTALAMARCVASHLDAGKSPDRVRYILESDHQLGAKSSLGERHGNYYIDWAIDWVQNGLPHLMPSHKLAASFMATPIPAEFCETVVWPWRAFLATVPAGVLSSWEITVAVSCGVSPDNGHRTARLFFMDREDRTGCGQGMRWCVCEEWAAYSGEDVPSISSAGLQIPPAHRRILQMVMRFVFGCCAELSGVETMPAKRIPSAVAQGRDSPMPRAWTLRLTRPVKVDCRAYVRAYAGGTRGSLKLQHMVCGHWKPRLSERIGRLVQVEPYWRGPPDAPIAVRPHLLEREP